MTRYVEYFVGGPLHGQIKGSRWSHVPDWGCVEAVTPVEVRLADLPDVPEEYPRADEDRWRYYRQPFVIGGIGFNFWTDARRMSVEMVVTAVAELIMAPHRTEVPR